MLTKTSSRILWCSLILGICFDVLFWKKPFGISFFLFSTLLTLACFGLGYWNGKKPAMLTWVLAGMILLFSAATFIRQEIFTTFINILITFFCLMLLALTYSSGTWLRYSLADAVTGFVRLISAMLAGGSTLLAVSSKPDVIEVDGQPVAHKKKVPVWGVVRGLLLAFPVVFLLALLLVSADPVFSKELKSILDFDRLLEYAVRVAVVCILAYLISGIYLYVQEKSSRTDLIGIEKPWFPAFLGFTESSIILASVNLLFAFFVGVQFKYFFGGQSNIVLDGYTYAEYARKGFGELVWVAVFSLLLFLALSTSTRRDTKSKQHWFSGLSLLLVSLVGVILVSAFMRLSLLESAYGFSRLRLYSHVFMVWLGVLLATVVALEIARYRRGFAITGFLVLVGFGLTLNFLNVDSFILRANIERSPDSYKLDQPYLNQLSNDSVPEMLKLYRSVKNTEIKDFLGASLVCHSAQLEDQLKDWHWQGYHVANMIALTALREASPELNDYTFVRNTRDRWDTDYVLLPSGSSKSCNFNLSRRD